MIEASMRGILDFRDADPNDRRWWMRMRMALDYLEREKLVLHRRLYYDYSLAILGRDQLTEQSNRQFVKDAETQIYELTNLWRPWDKKDPAKSQKAQIEALSTAWDREFGDRNDP